MICSGGFYFAAACNLVRRSKNRNFGKIPVCFESIWRNCWNPALVVIHNIIVI